VHRDRSNFGPIAPRARGARSRGFTLIETALATVIVGVGVLAIVAAQQAFHQQNAWSSRAAIATYLANEIREMTFNLPRHDPVTGTTIWGPEPNEADWYDFDDLDDFDGLTFSPPLNAQRDPIANMEGWAQHITVRNVEPNNITIERPNGSTSLVRVEVIVTFQGPADTQPMVITSVSWISPQ
jgi:prepilin-type N-terminal cleavage/methylation domain-containing protein